MSRPEQFERPIITVMGQKIQLDHKAELGIADLSDDMSRVAAQLGFWGSVWAAAVYEEEAADAHYRHWRAKMQRLIEAKDPKRAEWKVRADIEASPDFLKFKDGIARAKSNTIQAKTVFEAYDKKANQLQSKGAMARSEFGATGMHTPSEDPRVSAMREGNRKRRRKGQHRDD